MPYSLGGLSGHEGRTIFVIPIKWSKHQGFLLTEEMVSWPPPLDIPFLIPGLSI